MNVLSKCSDKYVLRGFTCYEVGHTWSASCLQAWKDVGFASYRTAFKIYFPLYLLAMFLKRRNQQKKSKLSQDLKKMFPELLRSTFFLGTNGLTFIVTFCLWRRLVTDSLTLVNTGFLPSFTCSAASVCFERKPRRSLLAVYMANIAMETIYLMLKTRKLIRPLPYGEVLLFSVSTSFFLYMYQSNKISGSMKSGIRFILGDSAEKPPATQERPSPSGWLPRWAQAALRALPGSGGGPPRCPNGHHDGCLISAIYKFGRMFAFGFGLQTALRLVTALASALQSARRRRSLVGAIRDALLHSDSLRFGAFLGGLSAIYKAVGCLLIRCCHGNQRPWQWAASGLAAGGSMLAYRSSSVAMYCASKAAELACSAAVGAGWLPRLPHSDILLYALSTGIVFHCAVFEPHSLRPAYWQFLLRMTDGHFDDINRRILDGLNGGHSSLLKPDFWPDYDPSVTSLALGPQEMIRRLLANRDSFNR
ncbi:hypothetical protein BOX15_Mlig028198g1 [Macrostomum lignano]|uniref:Transmembrane protein 135 N-terminal domain-containing protein n=1 Tax=Macrostomum lignano TaxID=282301 RepID=A0A267GCY6_9PLAT|nr:hypothetical protein BOX15_Mlig028198g1 [Macrostomum lignano]